MTAATRSRLRSDDGVAFGWGFAEAVLFFVIPDVFLTLVAVRFGFRRSFRLALLATAGAVVGGLVMYGWAALHPASAFGAMALLPGVDTSMIASVQAGIAAHGNAALLAGPWQGTPYKLFAAASGELGLSWIGLALLTIPGRLARFAFSIAIASYLRWFFIRWISQRQRSASGQRSGRWSTRPIGSHRGIADGGHLQASEGAHPLPVVVALVGDSFASLHGSSQRFSSPFSRWERPSPDPFRAGGEKMSASDR